MLCGERDASAWMAIAFLEDHCHNQRGKAIHTDNRLILHSIYTFIEPTKNSVKAVPKKLWCHIRTTAEFWLFTASGKGHRWGSFLIKKKHGKSREHSISSKTHRKKPIVHAGLWACQPFSQGPVLTGSIPKHDDRWLAIMNLHVEHITDSCLFALCPGPRLLGTLRIKMMGEVELRWTFLLYQRHSLP